MRFFFVIVLVLGIFFRFTHLDYKVYWYDEAIGSLRASGYTQEEVVQHFFAKSVVNVTELQRYQRPDGTRSVILTTDSNESVTPIHNRMPILIEESDIKDYLTNTDFANGYIKRKMPKLEVKKA